MDSKANIVELDKLAGLFYPGKDSLGSFKSVTKDEIPEPQRSLLAHDRHMTVTLEKFHSSPVEVVALQESGEGSGYRREIVLKRQSDSQVVQYGIVRLNFRHLEDRVQKEIVSKSKPLGRILIDHNVLRRVQLLSLYEIEPSARLAESMQLSTATTCFGRTAIIFCNDEPAIELLEVVRL